MAIIDLVSWSPQGNETIYAHKFPHTNLSTYTQLIVQESQEAVFFSKGRVMGKLGPGKHTLNTENLPLLRTLFGLPFGGKNPFTAEVWFVNKIQSFNIEWGIDKMPIHDADYNTQLPLTANGRYGLKIVDSEKFLIKVVGTKNDFSERDLTDQFYGEFSTKTKSAIIQFMQNNRIGYKSISASLDNISNFLKQSMSDFWNDLGIELTRFYVTTIDIDKSTEEGRRISDAIASQSSMSITGHTWQQEQMFGMANNAVENLGNGTGGLLGGLMALNMMGGFGNGGNIGGNMMSPQYTQPTFGGNQQQTQNVQGQMQQQAIEVYCSNCAKKYPSTHKFCPYCGDPYNPCPHCGTDNDLKARRCVSCGAQLGVENSLCPNCYSPIIPGSVFCGNCGQQLITSDSNCNRCGAQMPHNAKFCPKCGNRR